MQDRFTPGFATSERHVAPKDQFEANLGVTRAANFTLPQSSEASQRAATSPEDMRGRAPGDLLKRDLMQQQGLAAASSTSAALPIIMDRQVGARSLGVGKDSFLVLDLSPSRILVAVFDGYGELGHEIAFSVRQFLAQLAPAVIGSETDTPKLRCLLPRLFALAQKCLHGGGVANRSGTTATLAVIDLTARSLTCIHVGDSQLVVGSDAKVMFQTSDHVVDNAAALKVIAAGGEVQSCYVGGKVSRRILIPGLLGPGLAVSRTLGLFEAAPFGVSSEASVNTCLEIAPGSVVVVASRAFWQKVSPSEALQLLARDRLTAEESAQMLAAEARARWFMEGRSVTEDSTTVVVVQISRCCDKKSPA